jgi:transposase
VQLLVNRLNLNSRNSSKPPSTDFVKGDKKPKDGNNKPGGQTGLPISTGSVFNFNQQAFDLLAEFELKLIAKLIAAPLLHTDETGINIGGKRQWLHCASNERLTLFYAHAKRGTEAMDAKGVLPMFEGILCHDHWTDFCSCKICIPAFPGGQTLLPLQRMPALTLQRPPPA